MRTLILGGLSLALIGCGPEGERRDAAGIDSVSGSIELTPERLVEMQQLADASCLCEREKGLVNGPLCAEDYNDALMAHMPRVNLAEEVEGANPLAQTVATLDGNVMIVERYLYGACSAEEAAERKAEVDAASEF